MIELLLLIPVVSGIVAFFIRGRKALLGLLLSAAVAHSFTTAVAWWKNPTPILGGWLAVDKVGLLFLTITSFLFLMVAIYEIGYLKEVSIGVEEKSEGTRELSHSPSESIFIGCQLLFLGAITLVVLSQHFGLIWVAIEATTLASAPLIYFHRDSHSLEATWKYLLICSIGIALALLGIFFLSIAAASAQNSSITLVFSDLLNNANKLDQKWLKAAFILIVVGYGTKMGLAPLHTWLPDAHSESPSAISALLSGVLLNCAFVGIFRIYQVCLNADLGYFVMEIMTLFGVASLVVAAAFIPGQSNYKRLLAYSSVEHMGLLALGLGLGGIGVYGSMLHAVNHSISKAMLFLMSGVVLSIYRSKKVSEVKGLFSVSEWKGFLWMIGFLSITGTPPFGVFVSELTILKAAFDHGKYIVGVLTLAMLTIIFVGMASVFVRMSTGQLDDEGIKSRSVSLCPSMSVAPVVLGAVSLMLGFYIPEPLRELLMNIAKILN